MKPYGLKLRQGWYYDPWYDPKKEKVKSKKRERQDGKEFVAQEVAENTKF